MTVVFPSRIWHWSSPQLSTHLQHLWADKPVQIPWLHGCSAWQVVQSCSVWEKKLCCHRGKWWMMCDLIESAEVEPNLPIISLHSPHDTDIEMACSCREALSIRSRRRYSQKHWGQSTRKTSARPCCFVRLAEHASESTSGDKQDM